MANRSKKNFRVFTASASLDAFALGLFMPFYFIFIRDFGGGLEQYGMMRKINRMVQNNLLRYGFNDFYFYPYAGLDKRVALQIVKPSKKILQLLLHQRVRKNIRIAEIFCTALDFRFHMRIKSQHKGADARYLQLFKKTLAAF